jgi:hypothetical protein
MIRKLQALRSVRGVAFAVGVFVAAVLVLAGEKAAFAQAVAGHFGNQGQLVVTAENLFGFTMERVAVEGPNDTWEADTYSNFGVLHRATLFRGPWVGAHYFVIPNLSIGATLGFVTGGGSNTEKRTNGTEVTTDHPSRFNLVALPKVGYALMFTHMLGFWFRGGPGVYVSSTSSNPNPNVDISSSQTFWFLSVDALFVIQPVPNFGFHVGPQANLSFAGSNSTTNNNAGTTVSWDASFRSFSIDAGLHGTFDLM